MIEDPRELERKRLLGIDTDEVTRDDLVSALVDVCPSSCVIHYSSVSYFYKAYKLLDISDLP